jgi:hypothetical protein
MITIRKQRRGRWQDYLPKARVLHKESVERFWARLAEMARKENPSERPVLSAAQSMRVLRGKPVVIVPKLTGAG